jgi:hypothetical protein
MKIDKKIFLNKSIAAKLNSYAAGCLSVASFNNQAVNFEKTGSELITAAILIIVSLMLAALFNKKIKTHFESE